GAFASHLCGRAERRNSRPSTRVFRTSRIGKPPRRPLPFGSSVEALMAAPTQVNDLSWLIGGPQGSGVDYSVNVLATLEAETLFRHARAVTDDGAIIYDPSLGKTRLSDIPTIEKRLRA